MSDLPSQYTEDIETFRQIWALYDAKGQQELRPKGPFSYAPTQSSSERCFGKI